MDSWRVRKEEIRTGNKCRECWYGADLEIPRNQLDLVPRQRNTFDKRMFLGFKGYNGFVEYHTLVFFSIHPYKALHEVLNLLVDLRTTRRE